MLARVPFRRDYRRPSSDCWFATSISGLYNEVAGIFAVFGICRSYPMKNLRWSELFYRLYLPALVVFLDLDVVANLEV
jgi:hypothetical protein